MTEQVGRLSTSVNLCIVGSGFAGIGLAAQALRAGITDFVVLERADDVGGTWRDNTYPGAACDVPSHLYSFSFAPNPNWSRSFSPQAEIQAYLRHVAESTGVSSHVRFGAELLSARFDEDRGRWAVTTTAGDFDAAVLVSAAGALADPHLPDIPGLETFEGTAFHSSRWRHDHDLYGRRVAVVGTGASAIQFVPQIAPTAGHLSVFQRTPPWILPRYDRDITAAERFLFRHLPATQRLARTGIYWGREATAAGFILDPRLMKGVEALARRHLRRSVPDPDLRAVLTPDYTIGCKRILISDDYLPALGRGNVDVVPDALAEVRERSVVTAGGAEVAVDTIIFGTGFCVTEMPMARRVTGRGGRSLADAWAGGASAHRGSTVAGFPNLFLLVGPNTGLGHSSQVFMIESQIAYVIDALRHLGDRPGTVEVLPEAQAAWNDQVGTAMAATVWTSGGCRSWYLDAHGRNTTLWPGFTFAFRRQTRRFDAAAYQFDPVPERAPVPLPA